METDTLQTKKTSETFISENHIRYTKGLQDRDFRNTLDYVDTMGWVRVYDKNQRVFPNIMYKYSRLSLGQPPVGTTHLLLQDLFMRNIWVDEVR